MAYKPRKANKATFLPNKLMTFIVFRYQEFLGILLFAIGAFILLSLLSYDRSDPSFNTAIEGPIRNFGGSYGAKAGDFLIQLTGISSFAIIIVFWIWSWLKITHRPIGQVGRKILIIPFALLFFSIAHAVLSRFNLLQDSENIEGVLGYALLYKLQFWFIFLNNSIALLLISLLSLATGFILILYVLGLSLQEWNTLFYHLNKAVKFSFSSLYKICKWQFTPPPQRLSLNKEQKVAPAFNYKPSLIEPASQASLVSGNPENFIVLPSLNNEDEEKYEEEELTTLELNHEDNYQLPPLELLSPANPTHDALQIDKQILTQKALELKAVLEDFGIKGEITQISPGPVVTLYQLVPAPGIKSARVIGLADDIARSMCAISARVAVIPGHNAIGIELPNDNRQTVFLHELISSSIYEKSGAALNLVLGKDIAGLPVMADLTRMPHLLVAGTTGSGKSVGINSMILSLLYRLSPERCKLIMIDPKMLELSVYDGIPHLLTPVVTDPKKAVIALKWAVREMEDRYRAMSKLGVRNIHGYNVRVSEAKLKGENLSRHVQTGFDPVSGKPIHEAQPLNLETLPYIVVIVDEMADLMLVAGKEIEGAVQRLAQMARAAGIHLIMATQRPSVDVITGTIKANFPTRISFQVTSKIDSRTILGEQGAEQLLGQGDMLYMAAGGRVTRVHGPFVSDQEVENVVQFLKSQSTPFYIDEITEDVDGLFEDTLNKSSGNDLYDQAISLVCRERKATTSFIQRHLQIGYNRAARIMDQMEAEGLVSAANHVGKREILMRTTGTD